MTGKDIRKFIKERGVKVTYFAEITQIGREDIYRYMNGTTIPPINAAKMQGIMEKLYNFRIESKVK